MGRPQNKSKFKVFPRKGRPTWYMEYYSEKKDRIVQETTGYNVAEYTREQVQGFIDAKTGTKRVSKHSIEWLWDEIVCRLDTEGRTEKTVESYELAFRPLIAIYGKGYSIHNIGKDVISKVQRFLSKQGNSPVTINMRTEKLKAAFQRMYDDDIIDKNPFQGLRNRRLDEPDTKQQAFTEDELVRLLGLLYTHKNEKLRRLMQISIFTGLRRGQVLALKRDDINLNKGIFQFANNKGRKTQKKTIQRIPSEVSGNFLYFMMNSDSSTPFKVYQPNSYTCMVKRFLKRHKFPPDLHLHSCRHTAITRALDGGQLKREVSKAVGHSSEQVTSIYDHGTRVYGLDIGLNIDGSFTDNFTDYGE